MKKAAVGIAVAAVVIAGVFAFKGRSGPAREPEPVKPVVKIGAILPLTGDMANTGQSIRKGIEFAVADLNMNPANRFVYRAVFDNNQMQTRHTVPIAHKLIGIDRVAALMSLYSSNAKVVAPLLVQNKVIGLHGTYTDSILDGVYNFENLSTNAEIERAAIRFINRRRPEKIAFAIQQTPASLEMVAHLREALHGEIREFDILPDERDFKMLAYKMKEWEPDLVFVSADLPVLDIFVRDMRARKVGGIKLGLDLLNRTENFALLEGFYILNTSQGTEEFVERFGRPTTYYAPYFYDSVMIFGNAVEAAADADGQVPASEAVSREMHRIESYEGVVGKYAILENGKFETPLILYKIQDGRVIRMEEEP